MIWMTIYLLATALNLGVAIWTLNRFQKAMRDSRNLGRMEGFIEGVRSAKEGNVSVSENILVLN